MSRFGSHFRGDSFSDSCRPIRQPLHVQCVAKALDLCFNGLAATTVHRCRYTGCGSPHQDVKVTTLAAKIILAKHGFIDIFQMIERINRRLRLASSIGSQLESKRAPTVSRPSLNPFAISDRRLSYLRRASPRTRESDACPYAFWSSQFNRAQAARRNMVTKRLIG